MFHFASEIEKLPKDVLSGNPELARTFLPTQSPFIPLSERLAGTSNGAVRDFCRGAVATLTSALSTPPDFSVYSPEQLALATQNFDLLATLLHRDCEQGVITLSNYTNPFIPSRASIQLSTQLDHERETAQNFAVDVTVDALVAQLADLAIEVTRLEIDSQARAVFLGLIEGQKSRVAELARTSTNNRSKELAEKMSERSLELLDIIGLQFFDLRRYFSFNIPNRDYILALTSDEILRRISGRHSLYSFESIGVWIGDINSLSVANLQSHAGGDRYIGFVGDVLSGGLTSLILKCLGKESTELKSNREIPSMMRGADETGALMRLRQASIRAFAEVLNNLRLKEMGLYSVDDIVDLSDRDLQIRIGKILRLDKPYKPKSDEKFGAAVTFAGDSFLYALANTHLSGTPGSFYEALRSFMSCMLDTSDRRATILKDEVKARIAKDSPANLGLQSASRAFALLVQFMETNEILNQRLAFLTEGNLADVDRLERVVSLLDLTGDDQQLVQAVIKARNGNSEILSFLTGGRKKENIN